MTKFLAKLFFSCNHTPGKMLLHVNRLSKTFGYSALFSELEPS